MAGPYRITIYTAMPGTPLVDGDRLIGTSAAGHMWYQVSDGETKNSYGFAPKEHGASSGPGQGYRGDSVMYLNPRYARTMEITAEQYAKLKAFGEAAVNEDWRYFKGEYRGATNNCVHFTWRALEHAGFAIHQAEVEGAEGQVISPERAGRIENFFIGALQPARNVQDIQQLVEPVPGSRLNGERFHPPPNRTVLEKLISENGSRGSGPSLDGQRFKAQLGERLGQLGLNERQVETLAAVAAKVQQDHIAQGQTLAYHLSKDGSTVVLVQEYPPPHTFELASALARGESADWRAVAAMTGGHPGERANSAATADRQTQAAPAMVAAGPSRG